jgi:hypothetical protein
MLKSEIARAQVWAVKAEFVKAETNTGQNRIDDDQTNEDQTGNDENIRPVSALGKLTEIGEGIE